MPFLDFIGCVAGTRRGAFSKSNNRAAATSRIEIRHAGSYTHNKLAFNGFAVMAKRQGRLVQSALPFGLNCAVVWAELRGRLGQTATHCGLVDYAAIAYRSRLSACQWPHCRRPAATRHVLSCGEAATVWKLLAHNKCFAPSGFWCYCVAFWSRIVAWRSVIGQKRS